MDNPVPKTAMHVAIGVFDGLHLGHQAVLRSALTAAGSAGQALMVTFSPHPLKIVRPEAAPKLLMGPTLREKLLKGMGIAGVIEIPFTAAFAALSADEFVSELLKNLPSLASVSVGEDWRFGKGRVGNVEWLREAGKSRGFAVHGVAPVLMDGEIVSSTRIRTAVEDGQLALASRWLGRPYSLAGKVHSGRKLARKLGFPTANVHLEAENLPPYGVYAVQLEINGILHTGVANLGVRPTVESSVVAPTLEVHVFDYTGDLYGAALDVALGKFIRPERRLGSLEELQAQIASDCQAARDSFH